MPKQFKRKPTSRSIQPHKKKDGGHTSNNLSLIIGIPFVLTIIGLFFIFESSSILAFREIGDSMYFLKQQTIHLFLGLGVMVFLGFLDYKKFYYAAFPLLLITIGFLILVLIPGIGTHVAGARRWINLGPIGFQPTELAKFSVILYLSSWFLYKERQRFLSFLVLLGIVIGLIMLQPDLGTSIIIFSLFIGIYYSSGENLTQLIMLMPVAGGIVAFLVLTSEYRMRRLLAFFDPQADPQGVTYHINQILISLSSGGFFGRGFSSSRQKYQFLPEAHTDSIFAIIGEEIGFIGGIVIIGLYVYFLYLLYEAAKNAKDRFGRLLVSAIMTLVGLQVIINLAGMVNVLPLTGVPLPFISYGGSSLLTFFALLGIVVSVARRS